MNQLQILGFGLLYLAVIFTLIKSIFSKDRNRINIISNTVVFLFASVLGILIFQTASGGFSRYINILFWVLAIATVGVFIYDLK